MRYLILFSLLLFLFPLALADIGPSPSFSFSIANQADYPEHSFYFAGNIHPEELNLIEETNLVYKLDTYITVFAVPNELLEEKQDLIYKQQIFSQSIPQQELSLKAGHTDFEVTLLDTKPRTMQLKEKQHLEDANFSLGFLFFYLIPIAIFLIFVLIVLVGLFLVIKKVFIKK